MRRLCDFPVSARKACDAPMCDNCATVMGPDLDYCPDHKDKKPAAGQASLFALILFCLFFGMSSAAAQTCNRNYGVNCTPNLGLWQLPQNYPAMASRLGLGYSTNDLYNYNFRAIDKALGGITGATFSSLPGGTNSNTLFVAGSLQPAGGTIIATGLSGNPTVSVNGLTILGTCVGCPSGNFATMVGGTNPNALFVSNTLTPTGGGLITANALTGNPSVGVNNLNILGTCTGCPGSGSLPVAPALQQQVLQTDQSGVAHAVTEANTFIDPVNRHGMDNSGATTVGSALSSMMTGLSSTQPAPILLAPGFFNVSDGLTIPCTTSTCSGIDLGGSGRWATTIQSNCSVTKDVLKFNNTSSGPVGNNFHGIHLHDFTIKDTSGTGACRSLLDLVQQAGAVVERVGLTSAKGLIYSTGTLTVTNGSTAVVGSGTSWTAAMCPGLVQVAGYDQECTTVIDATHLTLTTNWQAATAAGTAYALDYNGNGVMLEAGPAGAYTQYITLRSIYSTGNRVCVYSVGTTSGGVSGVLLDGMDSQCEVRGSRTTDSVGHFWGSHTDTVSDFTPVNNVAFCVILESGHTNFLSPRCENDATVTPVTTCNGGVGLQSCTTTFQFAAGAGSTGFGNVVVAPYAYLFGTVFAEMGNNMVDLQILGLRSVSNPPFAANITNYNFNGTTGCPITGSGVKAVIQTYDCNHTIVAQTVN